MGKSAKMRGLAPAPPHFRTFVLSHFLLVLDVEGLRPETQHVARGHTYREIGEELHIAEKTVENHVRNILGKLHLNRKQELIRYAVEHGIE